MRGRGFERTVCLFGRSLGRVGGMSATGSWQGRADFLVAGHPARSLSGDRFFSSQNKMCDDVGPLSKRNLKQRCHVEAPLPVNAARPAGRVSVHSVIGFAALSGQPEDATTCPRFSSTGWWKFSEGPISRREHGERDHRFLQSSVACLVLQLIRNIPISGQETPLSEV